MKGRLFKVKAFAKARPALIEKFSGSSKFKVVNVYYEKELEFLAVVAGGPRVPKDGFEAGFKDLGVAMFLPIGARVWMTVESTKESADRSLHARPCLGPLIRW